MVVPNVKLEVARLSKRWSTAVASEKVGVSVNTFNRWERGLQTPQLSALDRLCQTFDLSPDELGFGSVLRIKQAEIVRAYSSQQAISPGGQCEQQLLLSAADDIRSQPGTSIFYPKDVCGCVDQYACEKVNACIERTQRSLGDMNLALRREGGEGVSRRQAIAALIGTPAAVFGISQAAVHLLHPEEVLSLCTVNIPLCWQLYFEGGLVEVAQLLPDYISHLDNLAKQPTRYQQQAANLASQGYQLASLVALQHQNFGKAHQHAQKALAYGERAGDPSLQATSLIRQAQIFLYLKRPRQREQVYMQSLQSAQRASPLLQGRIYAGLAETYGHLGQEDDAQHYLSLAHQTFPERYTLDPNYNYTHFNLWSISSLEGLMYLHLRQPKRAWDTFAKVEEMVASDERTPNRVELMVRQSEAACALDNRDMSCACVTKALQSALEVGNELRYNELYEVYEQMQEKWGHEGEVKDLEDLFL